MELLLWMCHIDLELKGTTCRLLKKGRGGTQSIMLPAHLEAEKQLALHSGLTTYREHFLQMPVKRSFLAGLIWLK